LSFKIAAIGDRDTLVGLVLAGTAYTHVHIDRETTKAKLNEFLSNEEIGLVILTHRVAEELGPDFKGLMRIKRLFPVVLTIPDKTGYVPRVDELTERIRRAVGAEVILKKEGG
jgi:vacuolar-type H+-ATPase subunit F/Vma7